MKANYLSLWALAGSASAYLATTTHYYDGQKGACGCGTDSGLDSWQLGIATDVYTAAGSQALFDTDDSSWCGGGCGKCYNLTSTGESPCSTCGTGGVAGDSIIIMVTNLCPYNGNEQWCPSVGATNDYGYSYHFDIMAESEVFGNNVVVDFVPVACPGQAVTDWETCECYGETDSDTTPAGMTSAVDSSGTSATSSASSVSSTSSSSSTVLPVSSTTAAESSPTTTLVTEASSAASTQAASTVVEPSSVASDVVAPSSTSTSAVVEPSSVTSAAVAPSSTASPAGTTTTTTTSVTINTVVTETITIWATPSSSKASSTSSSAAAVQSLYGQCGGINWTGATTCATGSTCKVQNPYYYQCVSSSD
ncbi:hypothetical protein UA08_06337 [Talaromyces atroroseus]|uniref:Cellulase n=1 Tax=Talaromyces atroroseus TaxID=1441469 RepID=A0A225AYT7_TALAT|nr:hypothetical protein UA08_06337 [Talaromyces atroroseus]OKL58667.1 hypothetical protein UA08_06337 [Talaromyces atroroseus]